MSLKIGIVGLPNVGKSTLFNALTKKGVPAANYPFCTIDPSVGMTPVPDERLAKLTALSQSAKTIPAIVEFVDIAGLVRGAAAGEGLGNQFLSHIREVDAIAQVVRVFEDADIVHVEQKVDPVTDVEIINLELVLADEQAVTKRLERVKREAKVNKQAAAEEKVLLVLAEQLKASKPARDLVWSEEEQKIVHSFQLLTAKPILYVLNSSGASPQVDLTPLQTWLAENKASSVAVDAVFETGLDDLIAAGYKLLNLITFFTTGADETRAWTTRNGALAPEAGRSIHSDFETKFIRAEVVAYDDLITNGSYAAARAKGLVRTEGKSYLVKDGDVIEFKI
jgi:GTP-binding protein YchF